MCNLKGKWPRRNGVLARTSAEKESITMFDPWTKSLVGIAEGFAPCVHYVEDCHVLPQSIAGQHGRGLYDKL